MLPNKVVEAVLERANDFCEVCGQHASESMAFHHRKKKSGGGKDTVANLAYCHHFCHNLATNSIHLSPAKAYESGFLVRREENPAKIPMLLHGAKWVLLDNDGNYLPFQLAKVTTK